MHEFCACGHPWHDVVRCLVPVRQQAADGTWAALEEPCGCARAAPHQLEELRATLADYDSGDPERVALAMREMVRFCRGRVLLYDHMVERLTAGT